MKRDEQNMKNRLKKAMKSPVQTAQDVENQNDNMDQVRNESDEKAIRKRVERPLKIFGGICIAAAIISLIFTGTLTVDTSEAARNAIKNQISTTVSAGTILSSTDENMEAKDYVITHESDAENTKIWVWDYAAEDGDYVQVLVNGTPVSDAFMTRHKPKELIVPASGDVQIKGVRDGGGGITYAVRYDINGTSYFNGTPEGEFNSYTLRKE